MPDPSSIEVIVSGAVSAAMAAGMVWAKMRDNGPQPPPPPTAQVSEQTGEHVSPAWMAAKLRALSDTLKGWPRHDERLVAVEARQAQVLATVEAIRDELTALRKHLDEEQIKRERDIATQLAAIASAMVKEPR